MCKKTIKLLLTFSLLFIFTLVLGINSSADSTPSETNEQEPITFVNQLISDNYYSDSLNQYFNAIKQNNNLCLASYKEEIKNASYTYDPLTGKKVPDISAGRVQALELKSYLERTTTIVDSQEFYHDIKLNTVEGKEIILRTKYQCDSITKRNTITMSLGSYTFFYLDSADLINSFAYNLSSNEIINITGSVSNKLKIVDYNNYFVYKTNTSLMKAAFAGTNGKYPVPFIDFYNIGMTEDKDKPLFSQTLIFNTTYDNPILFSNVIKTIKATDPTDGNITSQIEVISNEYVLTNGKINPGTYSFVLSATDTAGNNSTQEYQIIVEDRIPPVATGLETEVNYYEELSNTDLLKLFEVSDNCSNGVTVTIKQDDYSDNKAKVGAYTISAEVKDLAGNVTNVQATVNVIDRESPLIIMPELIKLNEKDLNKDFLIKTIHVYDQYDITDCRIDVSDTPKLLDNNQLQFVIVATDKSGNFTKAVLTVEFVTYDVIPVYAIKIVLKENSRMKTMDVLDALVANEITTKEAVKLVDTSSEAFDSSVLEDYSMIVPINGVSKEIDIEIADEETINEIKGELFNDIWWTYNWNNYLNGFKNWNYSGWNWATVIVAIIILGSLACGTVAIIKKRK